jgi:hypothetical protein
VIGGFSLLLWNLMTGNVFMMMNIGKIIIVSTINENMRKPRV